MILVVGATGALGGLIVTNLMVRGHEVRVLVRPGSVPTDLIEAGAHPVTGDLKSTESLRSACEGVDTVITTANASARGAPDTIESVDRRGNRHLVDIAEAAGVHRFVFVSALGADPGHPLPLLSAKGEAEERLRSSSMAWTVLRPDVFMDKLIPIVVGARALADEPVTLVGAGARRHSFVAMADVAAYAVAAVELPQGAGTVLDIGGPAPVSWRDVVTCFERELGRVVPVRAVSRDQAAPDLPPFVIDLLAALEAYDSPVDMSGPQSRFGVEPTPLADYVRAFVHAARSRLAG